MERKYVGPGYTIDRWKNSAGTNTTSELVDGGIRFTNTATSNMFRQDVENAKVFAGRMVTVSVLAAGEGSNTVSAYIRAVKSDGTYDAEKGNPVSTDIGMSVATLNVPEDVTEIYYGVTCSTNNGSAILHAFKFELGPIQTLAHKENDKWVLNSIPNYALELSKCQRYQVVYGYQDTSFTNSTYIAIGYAVSGTVVRFFMDTPVPLRGRPAVTITGFQVISNKGKRAQITRMSVLWPPVQNKIGLQAEVSGDQITAGDLVFLESYGGSRFILDSNL